jgi:N-acetylmuramoyl-L-alanine amidase
MVILMRRWIFGWICLVFNWPLLAKDFLDTSIAPEWASLDLFQNRINRTDFEHLLTKVYCPRASWRKGWIELKEKEVSIRKSKALDDCYILSFGDGNQTSTGEDSITPSGSKLSLQGLTIALDPGHIGGDYSKMEGRHFSIGESPPVKEGDLALTVAKILKKKLIDVGAKVILVREENRPVSSYQPQDFLEEVEEWIVEKEEKRGEQYPAEERIEMITDRSEVLFYRVSEINARADFINTQVVPDFVVCIHLNAAPWSDPDSFELLDRNDYHVLVNGCYMGGELADDQQRFAMIYRLLNGWHETELLLAENVSRSFSRLTKLPAFSYKGPNALKVGEVKGVWARNLLANRIYRCPVVFLEPYIANSKEAYERIQLGNYKGKMQVRGELKLSLVEEYAEAVYQGICDSFSGSRK